MVSCIRSVRTCIQVIFLGKVRLMQTITLRVPDELRTLIAEAAEANGQSQSDYMRQAIEIHVKRVDSKYDRQPGEKSIALTGLRAGQSDPSASGPSSCPGATS